MIRRPSSYPVGRLRGDNVVHADEGREAVEEAVRLALSPEGTARAVATANPYGTGDASRRILDIVRSAGSAGRVKGFVDADPTAVREFEEHGVEVAE